MKEFTQPNLNLTGINVSERGRLRGDVIKIDGKIYTTNNIIPLFKSYRKIAILNGIAYTIRNIATSIG